MRAEARAASAPAWPPPTTITGKYLLCFIFFSSFQYKRPVILRALNYTLYVLANLRV